MPVTAKLSRRFYEHFGDEITNELVDWMNSVDATYQSSLRELNELNFARFDAKLEQRIDAVENRMGALEIRLTAKIDGVEGKLTRKIDGVEGELSARIDGVEGKLTRKIDGVEERLTARIDSKTEGVEGRLSAMIAALDQRIDSCVTKVEFADRLAASESRMIRWMVGLWTSSILATIGVLVTVLRTR